MLEIEVDVPPHIELTEWESAIEAGCLASGLRVTLKGTLAQYPGSVHWHLKQGRQRGTLELTLWSQTRRLWFKVSAARQGAWMASVIPPLKYHLEQQWSSRRKVAHV